MDVVLADPLVVAIILGAAGMPATGAQVCKRWREALEYPEAWIGLTEWQKSKALRLACRTGDLKFVRQRFASLFAVSMAWCIGAMFTDALSQRPANLELVMWVAQKFDIRGPDVGTGMDIACREGDLQTVQWLVERYGDVYPDVFASGPLHLGSACASGRLDVAKWLTTRFKILASNFLAGTAWIYNHGQLSGRLDILKWIAAEFQPSREVVYRKSATTLYISIALGHRDVALWLIARYGVTEVNLSWFNKHDGSIKATAGGLWLVKQLGLNCRTSAYAICAHVRQIVALD
jgi:hypothetical protein